MPLNPKQKRYAYFLSNKSNHKLRCCNVRYKYLGYVLSLYKPKFKYPLDIFRFHRLMLLH